MQVKELIGKLAIRTKPTDCNDWSFCYDPVLILKVTPDFIVYSYSGTKDENMFGREPKSIPLGRYGGCWIDYEKMMELPLKMRLLNKWYGAIHKIRGSKR
jgi:hypothetical protein